MSYRRDRQWSDRFIPEIKQIIGPHLLVATPDEIDRTQAADLMVFTARDMTVAARVRRPGYLHRYPGQFTVRSHRDSGAETELSKIINGWGDWMLYGHSDAAEQRLEYWCLLDMRVFRAGLIRHAMQHARVEYEKRDNGDGTRFVSYHISSFPPSLVIAEARIETKKAAGF